MRAVFPTHREAACPVSEPRAAVCQGSGDGRPSCEDARFSWTHEACSQQGVGVHKVLKAILGHCKIRTLYVDPPPSAPPASKNPPLYPQFRMLPPR